MDAKRYYPQTVLIKSYIVLRLSKIADYGTKIMLAVALKPNCWSAASSIAAETKVSLPMVIKVLKMLSKGSLLLSQRGSQGGYRLARSAAMINLAEIVRVLDGDIAMTECQQQTGCCQIEAHCGVKGNWLVISHVIINVLQNISLAQMSQPIQAKQIPLIFDWTSANE